MRGSRCLLGFKSKSTKGWLNRVPLSPLITDLLGRIPPWAEGASREARMIRHGSLTTS